MRRSSAAALLAAIIIGWASGCDNSPPPDEDISISEFLAANKQEDSDDALPPSNPPETSASIAAETESTTPTDPEPAVSVESESANLSDSTSATTSETPASPATNVDPEIQNLFRLAEGPATPDPTASAIQQIALPAAAPADFDRTDPMVVLPKISITPDWEVIVSRNVTSVDVSDDGRYVIVQGTGRSKNVEIWDVEKQQRLHSFNNPTGQALPVAISPDGSLAAFGGEYVVAVRDVASGRELHDLKPEKDYGFQFIRGVIFNSNRDMLLAAEGPRVFGWNLASGQQLFEWQADGEEVTAVSNYFDQGKKIATSGEGEKGIIKIWDVASGKVVQSLTAGPQDKVTAISVSPDGKTMATANLWQGIHTWDVAANKVLNRLKEAQGWSDIQILPSGKSLLYCLGKGDIIYFDLPNSRTRWKLCRHTSEKPFNVTIWSLAVTPNGETLVSGGDDGTIKVWDLKPLQ